MTVLASEIITRVREILADEADVQRWTDAELLRHLSDGQRTIASMFPDAATKVASMQLAEGTRQTIPADGERLLSVYRNMGTDGLTPGRAIRLVKRELLDDQNPMWHADSKVTVVYNYTFDPADEEAFFVYPPSNGNGYVEINYCYNPPEVDALTDEIEVSDIYQTPLVDFVLYKAMQKDSDFAAGMQRATAHLQAFMLFMQGSPDEKALNPNTSLGPFNLDAKGAAK